MTQMKRIVSIVALVLGAVGAQAQDLIVAKQGDPVKAWNVEVSDKYVFYSTEPGEGAPILRMAKENILMIRKANGSSVTFTPEQTDSSTTAAQGAATVPVHDTTPDAPVINEQDIHGSLIAEGNCVYIPTDSPLAYEQAGQQRVKEYMQQWGYWKVVGKPEQAHFVLQFTTQTSGDDRSFLIIRPRKYYAAHPTLTRNGVSGSWTNAKGKVGVTVNWTRSNEDVGENTIKGQLLAEHLKGMVLAPDKGDGKRFFKYQSKYLDADNVKGNNSSEFIISVR